MTRVIDALERVSRVNGRDLKSDRIQYETNVRAIEIHGFQVGERVPALNVSGGLVADGEQWQRALRRVEQGHSAGVSINQVDRLSRNVARGLAWVDSLASAGGVLISGARIINLTNPHERAMFIGELNNAELQLNIYKERSREVMADVRKRGVSNRLNYGYRRNEGEDPTKDPKAFLVDDEQAETVRMIFRMRADGARWPAVIDKLHDLGVRSPSGNEWWVASTLASMVASRVYLGEVKMGEHVTKGAHDRLVSPDLWRAAQSTEGRVFTGKNKSGVAHGLLVCSGCGVALQVQRNGNGRTFYGCRRRHSSGPCPAPVNGDQGKLDAFVDDLVAGALEGAHGLDAVQARKDLTEAVQARREAESDLEAFLSGTKGLSAEIIAHHVARHQDEIARAIAAEDQARAQAKAAEDLPESGDAYRRLPLARRQKVAQALIARITLDPFPPGAGKRGANPADRARVRWA